MRIEISAGGLSGGIGVLTFQSGIKSYISKADNVISSFKAVTNKTYNLNGNVGNLADAVNEVNARIRTEESRKSGAENVQRKANDFLDLAIRVDKSVANMVNQNREILYGKYPNLRPSPGQWVKDWFSKALDGLCKIGKAIYDTANWVDSLIASGLQKIGRSIVAFYEEHKELIGKIVGTVLIIAGAVLSIAAVIATGGLALAPLIGAALTALGISATTAAAIAAVVSAVVGVTAIVSTLGASTMNVVDIWANKSDDATFQKWKKIFSVVSIITNTLYSIGNLYNAYKGITGAEYVAKNTKPPQLPEGKELLQLPEGEKTLYLPKEYTPESEFQNARQVGNYIENHNGSPPSGYKGGSQYNNIPKKPLIDQKLPGGTTYKEYDVAPTPRTKPAGFTRGLKRLVIGDDGSWWYTNDHYSSFYRIK